MGKSPLVSICVPVLNGASLIDRALGSALEQRYEPLEIIVADDRSTDGTPDLIRRRYGDRVQLVVNRRRAGLCGNHNVAVTHSNGQFIKFLHHDDFLLPDCASKMVASLQAHPTAGLVFCRRRVELVDDAPQTDDSVRCNLDPPSRMPGLKPVNAGPALLESWLQSQFPHNWIGEPVTVMVRREALSRVGLFNPNVRQLMDIDLWMRISGHYDVAFIDEELAIYRHGGGSSTERTVSRHEHWLDPLWILEGLASDAEVTARHPSVVAMRRAERRMTFRHAALGVLRIQSPMTPMRIYWKYARYRARKTLSRLASRGARVNFGRS